MRVLGIHHVTAIAGEPQRDLDFYAGVLGLRLVKRTVDFDDPRMYHLFYGDEVGTPGTLLTTIPWPGAFRGRAGAGQAGVVSFAITPSAIGFWVERLLRNGIAYEPLQTRTLGAEAERVLALRGPDGMLLELVAHPGAEALPSWGGAPGIPAGHAIRGIHSVALWVEAGEPTARVLADVLGFRSVAESGSVRRYAAGEGGVGTFIDVREIGGFVRGEEGVGTVHHVALRVADESALLDLRQRLIDTGLEPSEAIDRYYFRSVYVREPGGILFELATDGPGLTLDEPVGDLGRSLRLPPRLEGERATIEAALPPLRVPGPPRPGELVSGESAAAGSPDSLDFVHRYLPPAEPAGHTGATTLLMLHGTGGDEDDLLPLGRQLLPGAGMLSPRGRVMENGMPRFFRRHAMGVLDQADLERRTAELADFLDQAAEVYGFERARVVAVGFSNGANIATSLLLRRGAAVRAAVLLSPMLPFELDVLPDLAGVAVFIGAGRADPLVPAAQVEQLAAVLERAGAEVTVHWEAGGHMITPDEMEAARRWLAHLVAPGGAAPGEASA